MVAFTSGSYSAWLTGLKPTSGDQTPPSSAKTTLRQLANAALFLAFFRTWAGERQSPQLAETGLTPWDGEFATDDFLSCCQQRKPERFVLAWRPPQLALEVHAERSRVAKDGQESSVELATSDVETQRLATLVELKDLLWRWIDNWQVFSGRST